MTRPPTHDEVQLLAAMQELANTPVDGAPLPDPSFIWWKAQLLRRHEAERDAIAPIAVGDCVHIGGAILGAVALALGAWTYVPTLAFTPAIALTVAGSALILLTVLTVATFESLRDRWHRRPPPRSCAPSGTRQADLRSAATSVPGPPA